MATIKLPSSVMTPKDIQQLINEVRTYTAWFNKELIKRRVSGDKHIISSAPDLSPATKEFLREQKAQGTLDRHGLEQLLFALEQQRKQAPTVTVTLAAPAPVQLQEKIVSWFRTTVRGDIFVSFQFDATLLGGAVVRAGSRIIDASLREKVLNPSVSFAEVLRRV